MLTEEQENRIKKELEYQTSRSGGKGGQNVNKVETRVEVIFDVQRSQVLSDQQRERILSKLAESEKASIIRIVSSGSRSQLANKEEAREKLFALLNKLLKVPVKRRPTKKSRSSKEKNLQEKKKRSEIKALRRRDW